MAPVNFVFINNSATRVLNAVAATSVPITVGTEVAFTAIFNRLIANVDLASFPVKEDINDKLCNCKSMNKGVALQHLDLALEAKCDNT